MNDLKNVKQVLHRPHDTFGHLVLLDFTFKSLRNHAQKYYVFSSQGVRTHPVCLRHCCVVARQYRSLCYTGNV